jgi:hypothetical protein
MVCPSRSSQDSILITPTSLLAFCLLSIFSSFQNFPRNTSTARPLVVALLDKASPTPPAIPGLRLCLSWLSRASPNPASRSPAAVDCPTCALSRSQHLKWFDGFPFPVPGNSKLSLYGANLGPDCKWCLSFLHGHPSVDLTARDICSVFFTFPRFLKVPTSRSAPCDAGVHF